MTSWRWDPCVYHLTTKDVVDFSSQYFGGANKSCLLVAGAGFDPRSVKICEMLSEIIGGRLDGFFIREERPNPDGNLLHRADANHTGLEGLVSNSRTIQLEVFADDGAPIAGPNIVHHVGGVDIAKFDDIVIDLSALSIGVSFPLVRCLQQLVLREGNSTNLHLMVTASSHIDATITSEPSDRVTYVKGFDGRAGITGETARARLWLPQLARGRNDILERIRRHDLVNPHDICPILPFPSRNPREADVLADSYMSEFKGDWEIDGKDIVHADEYNPLDLYRTILRIDDQRTQVFAELGGSLQILSPMGSKLLAIGALMAALDRNLPVVYVESIGYSLDSETADELIAVEPHFVHVWLEGDCYPPRRC